MTGRLGPGPEFDLIRRFLGTGRGAEDVDGVLVGPGDDCAVVEGEGIILSTDMSVEGVHFRREWLEPEEIGWRAASAALSDLAAMAARSLGVLASVAVPAGDAGEYAVRLMVGVREAVESVGGALLGGDLTRSPGPVVVDVTVVGQTAAPVLRSGAAPGDEVWVTGSLGGSALAVADLLEGRAPDPASRARFARPRPRIPEARWLAARTSLSALIDISDGLAGDAAHVAAASGVSILLEAERVPIDSAVRAAASEGRRALDLAASGGEDYELCLTCPPGSVEALRADFERELGTPLTRVGRVEEGRGVHWLLADGRRVPVPSGGYQHFDGVR